MTRQLFQMFYAAEKIDFQNAIEVSRPRLQTECENARDRSIFATHGILR